MLVFQEFFFLPLSGTWKVSVPPTAKLLHVAFRARSLTVYAATGASPQHQIYGFSQDAALTKTLIIPEKRLNPFSLTPAESQQLWIQQNGKKPSYDSVSKFTRKKGAGVLVL